MKVAGETDFRRRSLGLAGVRRQAAGCSTVSRDHFISPFLVPVCCLQHPASEKRRSRHSQKKKPLCSRSGQAAKNNSKGVLKNNCSPVCNPGNGPGQLLRAGMAAASCGVLSQRSREQGAAGSTEGEQKHKPPHAESPWPAHGHPQPPAGVKAFANPSVGVIARSNNINKSNNPPF